MHELMWNPSYLWGSCSERSPLLGQVTYLSWADVFGASQEEDLLECKSKSRAPQACRRAVVDGPHERQGPGAHQFHEEDPDDQGQAVPHRPLGTLAVLQESSNQQRLNSEDQNEVGGNLTRKEHVQWHTEDKVSEGNKGRWQGNITKIRGNIRWEKPG